MKMRNSVLALSALLAGVSLALAEDGPQPGRAAGGRPGRGPGQGERGAPGMMMARGDMGFQGDMERLMDFLDDLQLTDDQEAKIATVLKESRETLRDAMKASMEARQKINEAIQAEKFDEPAIRTACQAAEKAEEEAAVLRAKAWQQITSLLTPEQKTQIKAARDKAAERIKQRAERLRKFSNLLMDARAKPQ